MNLTYTRWYATQNGYWWSFTPAQFRAMLAYGAAQDNGVNLDDFGKIITRRPAIWYLGNVVKVLDWDQEMFAQSLAEFDRDESLTMTYSPKRGE